MVMGKRLYNFDICIAVFHSLLSMVKDKVSNYVH